MKTKTVTVKGKRAIFLSPETMKEARELVVDEEDLMVLIRFGLHHRMRSVILGRMQAGAENAGDLSGYVFHRKSSFRKEV